MRYMPLREFLRGGYQHIDQPTIVMKHGYPVFSVFPAPGRIDASKDSSTTTRGGNLRAGPPGPSPNGG